MPTTSTLATAAVTEPPAQRRRGANPALHDTPAELLVLVVARGNGRFHPQVSGGSLRRGHVLGRLELGGGRHLEVRCPIDMVVRGLLTRRGQLVTAGVALAWGERSPAEPAE